MQTLVYFTHTEPKAQFFRKISDDQYVLGCICFVPITDIMGMCLCAWDQKLASDDSSGPPACEPEIYLLSQFFGSLQNEGPNGKGFSFQVDTNGNTTLLANLKRELSRLKRKDSLLVL